LGLFCFLRNYRETTPMTPNQASVILIRVKNHCIRVSMRRITRS